MARTSPAGRTASPAPASAPAAALPGTRASRAPTAAKPTPTSGWSWRTPRTHLQHGQEHVDWDGYWWIRTGQCWVATHAHLDEAARDAELTDPGTYRVEWDADDEYMSLHLVDVATTPAAS